MVALAFSVVSSAARAGSPGDVAAAQGLYDDARKLMHDGNYAPACPKLEESNRLDKSTSTEFHLADCYEHTGRTASAWALFLQVASESRAQGRADAEQIARDRATALSGKLARLTVNVGSPVDGLEVKRDAEALGQAQWNSAVPVDPGTHSIAAHAPGHQDWSGSVVVADGKTASIDIPALVAAAAAPTSAAPATAATATPGATTSEQPVAAAPASTGGQDTSRGLGGRRTVSLVIGGAGLVALGVGGYFGFSAISKNSDSNADNHCVANRCDPIGTAARNDAVTAGNISTVLVGVGAVAVVAAGVLWLTAPRTATTATTAQHVDVGIGPGSLLVKGVF
jgi:serine/threonine-protein kinase